MSRGAIGRYIPWATDTIYESRWFRTIETDEHIQCAVIYTADCSFFEANRQVAMSYIPEVALIIK